MLVCGPATDSPGTTACWPTRTANTISPPFASFCISRHPRPSPTQPTASIMGTRDRPSCADIAALRCSSLRPSHALSTSADRPLLGSAKRPCGAAASAASTTGSAAFLARHRHTPTRQPRRDRRLARTWAGVGQSLTMVNGCSGEARPPLLGTTPCQ
jgi:hypothetical protein